MSDSTNKLNTIVDKAKGLAKKPENLNALLLAYAAFKAVKTAVKAVKAAVKKK